MIDPEPFRMFERQFSADPALLFQLLRSGGVSWLVTRSGDDLQRLFRIMAAVIDIEPMFQIRTSPL